MVNKVHQETMGTVSGDPRDREEAKETKSAWKPMTVSAESQEIGTGTFARRGSLLLCVGAVTESHRRCEESGLFFSFAFSDLSVMCCLHKYARR